MDNRFWEEQFQLTANADVAWARRADVLKRAADVVYDVYMKASKRFFDNLRRDIGKGTSADGSRLVSDKEMRLITDIHLRSVYYMLMGFAIENTAKGILVSRDSALDSKKKFRFPGHNLAGLVERCDLEIDAQEKAVLKTLAAYVKWKGRYPIPLSPGQFTSEGKLADDLHRQHDAIEALYSRLQTLFWGEYAKRMTSK